VILNMAQEVLQKAVTFVPFYLRSGKRLSHKLTETTAHFKPTAHLVFPTENRSARNSLETGLHNPPSKSDC
jgi:glucose-6-phosphate 1-dehydrogenase